MKQRVVTGVLIGATLMLGSFQEVGAIGRKERAIMKRISAHIDATRKNGEKITWRRAPAFAFARDVEPNAMAETDAMRRWAYRRIMVPYADGDGRGVPRGGVILYSTNRAGRINKPRRSEQSSKESCRETVS